MLLIQQLTKNYVIYNTIARIEAIVIEQKLNKTFSTMKQSKDTVLLNQLKKH